MEGEGKGGQGWLNVEIDCNNKLHADFLRGQMEV